MSSERVEINGGCPGNLIGTKICFRDLVSRSDLNGERGTIIEWLASRGRYNVKTDKGEVIAVKPANLLEREVVVKTEEVWDDPTEGEKLVAEGLVAAQRLNGATVEFQWLNGRSDLNGQKAVVEAYLEDRSRYNVKISSSGEIIAVKPGNIKTIAPYTHHYLKRAAEELEQQKKGWASVKAGDMISAKNDVMTDCKEPVKVPKGTRGTVVRMDKDGDACIKFDGIKDRRWVHKEKFAKNINVRMSAESDAPTAPAPTKKSPLKKSTATNQTEKPQEAAGKAENRRTDRQGLRAGLFD